MSTSQSADPVRVPFVVSVTGHRFLTDDVDDRAEIRRQVGEALDRYGAEFAGPRILLSALAQGADQLVARMALDRGWQLVAVLPFDLDDYLATFTRGDVEDDAARQTFHELLAEASFVVSHELVAQLDAGANGAPSVATDEAVYEHVTRLLAVRQALHQAETGGELALDYSIVEHLGSATRRRTPEGSDAAAYNRVGRFLADSCHLLVAIWDQRMSTDEAGALVPREEVSGTEYVVRYAAEKGLPTRDPGVIATEAPFIVEIRGARAGQPQPPRDVDAEASTARTSDPDRHFALWRSVRRFNGAIGEVPRDASLGDDRHARLNAAIWLANRAQTGRQWHFLLAYGAILVAFVLLLLFALLSPPLDRWAAWGFGLCVIAAVAAWRIVLRRRYDDDDEDYRALAEALRIATEWQAAGVVGRLSAFRYGHWRSEQDWLRLALLGWELAELRQGPVTADDNQGRKWLADQIHYHGTSASRRRDANHRLHWLQTGCLGLALALFLGTATRASWAGGSHPASPPGASAHEAESYTHDKHIAVAGIHVLLVIAALANQYRRDRAFAEQADQHARMARVLREVSALPFGADRSDPQKPLRIAGEAMVTEIRRWASMKRSRKFEVPDT